jgi:hypothetical protein
MSKMGLINPSCALKLIIIPYVESFGRYFWDVFESTLDLDLVCGIRVRRFSERSGRRRQPG